MSDVSEVGAVARGSESATAQPRSQRKGRRYLLRGAIVLVVALALAQVMYTLSGSGKWEYVDQARGIKVYSMKVRGVNAKKFMAVLQIKSTMTKTVAFLSDDYSDVADGGFITSKLLKQESSNVRWTHWRMRLARPMDDRDFVVKHMFTQDPVTKEVLYTLTAKPYMIPEDPCCVRVLRMDNSWRLKPLENGAIEVRLTIDMDIGGWAPYFVVNKWVPWEMMNFGASLQEAVDRKKYANAQLDYIQDVQS